MKRLLDIICAGGGLLLLSPLLLWLAWRVRQEMGSPVLFTQERLGIEDKPFHMIKFRSMRDALGSDGQQLPDLERLTPLGQKLRSSSTDELPELWNVLKGDMSLVGPRPLLMEYLPLYTPDQARRHEVRPGITGWAQVNGRNAISWDEKFALDVWYVDNRTFWLDLKILALTILKLFARDGIMATGGGTMPTFRGSSENAQNDEKRQE
jgi:lipopolysaccharide/colanic/teichoic acid biosynthesis glycosyltransferase